MVLSTMTKTIGKDSNLRKLLEGWRGQPFTDKDINEGFDVESLVGVPCIVNVVHRTTNENTYANVASVMRLMKGVTPMKPDYESYTRVQDRSPEDQAAYLARFRGDDAPAHGTKQAPSRPVDEVLADDDDDLPF